MAKAWYYEVIVQLIQTLFCLYFQDWQLIEIAFIFYCPPKIPEFDAIKSLTVSEKVGFYFSLKFSIQSSCVCYQRDVMFQMASWLIEASKMMPKAYEEFMIPEDRIEECLTLDQPLPVQNHYLRYVITAKLSQ